jgi:hypothetical protein
MGAETYLAATAIVPVAPASMTAGAVFRNAFRPPRRRGGGKPGLAKAQMMDYLWTERYRMAVAKKARAKKVQAKAHIPRCGPARSMRRSAVSMAEKKLEGLRETLFLLGSPKNAARLRSALAEAKAGNLIERELDE